MKITKLYEVKTPYRATPQSAGIDLYIPEYSEEYENTLLLKNGKYKDIFIFSKPPLIQLRGGGKIFLPLGIKVKVPKNYVLIAFNKSGVSWNQEVIRLSSVIDEDYRGELSVTLHNYGTNPQELQFGQRIIQAILLPVFYDTVEEISEEEYTENDVTERGAGGFGSTGVE